MLIIFGMMTSKKKFIWGGEQESKNAFNILTKRCKNVYNRIHCQD